MKYLRISGHLFFLFYFALAFRYHNERILLGDAPFYLFKIINSGSFNIEHSRFSSFVTQILPLLGSYLHLKLRWIIVLYSVSFPLIYYTVFLVCAYRLKNDGAIILLASVLALCTRQGFYEPVTETHLAMVFGVLLYAWMSFPYPGKKSVFYMVGLGLALFCFFSHPSSVFVVAAIFLLEIIKKNFRNVLPYILLLVFVVLLYSLKLVFIKSDSYEGSFLSDFKSNISCLSCIPLLNSWIFLKGFFTSVYLAGSIVFLGGIMACLSRKKFRLVIYYLFILTGFLLFALITFADGGSQPTMERQFLSLAFFAALPLAEEINKNKFLREETILAFLIPVFIFCFSGIFRERDVFSGRTAYRYYIKTKTENLEGRKFIIQASALNKYLVDNEWSFPFEMLLYTACAGADSAKTVYIQSHLLPQNPDIENKSLFLGSDFALVWDTRKFNQHYFRLPEEKYVRLTEIE